MELRRLRWMTGAGMVDVTGAGGWCLQAGVETKIN